MHSCPLAGWAAPSLPFTSVSAAARQQRERERERLTDVSRRNEKVTTTKQAKESRQLCCTKVKDSFSHTFTDGTQQIEEGVRDQRALSLRPTLHSRVAQDSHSSSLRSPASLPTRLPEYGTEKGAVHPLSQAQDGLFWLMLAAESFLATEKCMRAKGLTAKRRLFLQKRAHKRRATASKCFLDGQRVEEDAGSNRMAKRRKERQQRHASLAHLM